MDMDKFTKYAIYFLIGIIGYYLLFNNEMVEGFKSDSPEAYQFTVDASTPVDKVNVTLNIKTSPADPKPSFNNYVAPDTFTKYNFCQKLLNSINSDIQVVPGEDNPSIFYTGTDTNFTYVMLNYTNPVTDTTQQHSVSILVNSYARMMSDETTISITIGDLTIDFHGSTDPSSAPHATGPFKIEVSNAQTASNLSDAINDNHAFMVGEGYGFATASATGDLVTVIADVGSDDLKVTATGVGAVEITDVSGGTPPAAAEGVYILKYPTIFEPDIEPPPDQIDKIEIYKIENIINTTPDNSATITVKRPSGFVANTRKTELKKVAGEDTNLVCGAGTCKNNGSCTEDKNNANGFKCACVNGYTGQICDIPAPAPANPNPNPNPIITKCIKSHPCDEFGFVSNASKTCAGTICTNDECCTDTDWELYGGIFCCCVFLIAFIVGILYLFSSRSSHKRGHKIYKDVLEKTQGTP